MKSFINIISIVLLLIISTQINGQKIITKNDTIPITKDTILLTVPSTYRGTITWQQSLDNENWINYLNSGDSIFVQPFFNASYRAKIEDGTCSPIYTDTIKIVIADSIKTASKDSLFEVAYPDSVGEIVQFKVGNDTLACNKINGEYVFQGDIILDESQIQILDGLKGAGLSTFEAKHWPENIVYYKISCVLDRYKVVAAINHWNEKTTLTFIERTDHIIELINPKNYIDFVSFTKGSSSKLGMRLGRQEIKLQILKCDAGTAIHEIGHAVGLLHEQSRSDRDHYIKVDATNIKKEFEHNFKIWPNSINVPAYSFDFQSIMLYPSFNNFAIDPKKPTMTKLDNSIFDPQRSQLTYHDIATVNFLYPPVVPKILRINPTNITNNTATCGGEIISDGGADVTSRGVCWNTTGNPTITDFKTTDGTGTGIFISDITGLTCSTTYYLRAYATNNVGTSYGTTYRFETKCSCEDKFDSFTDSRDGHVYKTIEIGTQTWMAENLAYLPDIYSFDDMEGNTPGYYVHDFDTYGVLYNWVAALNSCPAGWHLPSNDEWNTLSNYLGGDDIAGYKMKTITGWYGYKVADNSSCFTGLGGGKYLWIYHGVGKEWFYWSADAQGNFWSSIIYNSTLSWSRALEYNHTELREYCNEKSSGLSVRCIKNY